MTSWFPPTLETPRLILRPLQQDDDTAVFLYASNPNLTRYTLFETHRTIDESRWFVNEYAQSRYAAKEPEPLGILIKDDPLGMIVGSVGAFWVSQPHGVMEMGYTLSEPHWGRGYIVEAAQALMRFVFDDYAIQRLQARVIVGNAASERVVQKLGFTREGVLRSFILRRGSWWDLAIWSLLRGEFDRMVVPR